MKPTKSFRLSKRSKTMVALLKRFTSQVQRDGFKNMMIQAELAGAVRVKPDANARAA